MKKLSIIIISLLLSSCAVLDTIDSNSYVQYIEASKDQNCFIIQKVANTHNKKLGKYNYVFYDNNDKIKLFWGESFPLDDTVTIVSLSILRKFVPEYKNKKMKIGKK